MLDKDEIKDRVLTENTAQGILNHLRELESNRARMQRRWIWELLQNARDASADEDSHLVASIELTEGELAFRHNGRGFTVEEVAHLIYHGSTKLEDEIAIGQYGSGFLTTHLLSPQINVAGQLNDGRPFDFRLKREISSSKALSDSMDKAWDEFDASADPMPNGFTTRFRYPIEEDSAGAVEEGVETLKRCAPFVVVFNRQFRQIAIKAPEETISFEVIERVPLHKEGLQKVTVGVSDRGRRQERKYVLAEGQHASVTVPLEPTEDGPSCLPLNDVPRLFLGFPLIGTENFSFPAVINSFRFTPTEHRDGVYLGQSDDEANRTNQAIIAEACELHANLIEFVADSRWKGIHTLAEIPPISEQTWLKETWIKEQLELLVARIRETPAVLSGQEPASPRDAVLPVARDYTGVETLWNLLSEVRDFRLKLPKRDEAAGWRNAADSWATVTDCAVTSFGEAVDGVKLAKYIEEESRPSDDSWGTLDGLQNLLVEEVCAVEWLNRLIAFLKGEGLDTLIREGQFIPDQSGILDKLSNLYRDTGVDDELKDIADRFLELNIRESFRDSRLTSLADEVGKGDRINEDIIREIVDSLKKLCEGDTLTDDFAHASARTLAWIVTKRKWDYLTGFPAFSTRPADGSYHVLRLGSQGGDDADRPLAPVKAWPEGLQEFADLFPWTYIVADAFFEVMPDPEIWQTLSKRATVRKDVVIRSERSPEDFLPDHPLADGEHGTEATVTMTDLAFLTKDRVGIMARVRDSQDRARLFWRFLTEWLVVKDIEGFELKKADCVCGVAHRYFRANWLVPLVNNHWVPQGNNIRVRATARSLAKLLRGSGWTPDSVSETSPSVRLLDAMSITRFDLMREFMASDDESRASLDDVMTNILVSTDGDLIHVRQFVEDMKTDKDLPAYLAERRERKQIVQKNQKLGNRVEELVKKGLEDEGFTVRRTGIGSDFEIEYDLIEGDEEIGIELSRNGRSWLVEVKATRDQRVRMTAKQAETAVDKSDGFLLCVVPVGRDEGGQEEDEIRTRMRFVQDIGPRVEPLCAELDALNDLRDALNDPRDDATAQNVGDIQLEIQAGAAKIRVDNTVWQNGVHLKDLSAQLIGTDSAG